MPHADKGGEGMGVGVVISSKSLEKVWKIFHLMEMLNAFFLQKDQSAKGGQ